MALMRPTDPVFEGGGSRAERRFFEALRDELSDDWTVYHGLPYYDLKHGARCGEIDFLLLHPAHGLLVVECKGTGVTYRQGEGRWYRHVDGGDEEPLQTGPLRQAEGQAYDFVRFLERQLPARFPELDRFPFVFGYAAAFPRVGRFPAPQPPDLPPELVFTAEDRGGLEPKAIDILDRFASKLRTRPPGLAGRAFKTFRKHVLRDALASPDTGSLIVFHDPAQDLFGRRCELPEGANFHLVDNFRNTQQISELINRLGFAPLQPHLMCPVGDAPTVRTQGTPAQTRKELDSLIRRLTGTEGFSPEQIALLTPRTRPHSSLAGLETLADLGLAHDPLDREGRLLHCTVGRFKGLESDVVILLDIEPGHQRSGREVRYCGASRAKHLLYVFVKGKWEQE
jgi:hypothetical protein